MKTTEHNIYFTKAQEMKCIGDNSIDLVVTSPPYPMIEMWDDILSIQNPNIKECISTNPNQAFELMHQELDKVWTECFRVVKDGGFICINIGDATRTINGVFQLFNNHSRIINFCHTLGLINLPNIIWRKQTNAPNKFMGSGMLPCGAYVTLEHEWILVFRKGEKRIFKSNESKLKRQQSSYFWEERNTWFSDVWELKGVKQKINKSQTRERSASYPFEIPYRLINMYSQEGDVVLDPFFGLGTTTIAAMALNRNSVGIEIDDKLKPSIIENITSTSVDSLNKVIQERYNKHIIFIRDREGLGKEAKYFNKNLQCKVMTKQEIEMTLHYLKDIAINENKTSFICSYEKQSDMNIVPFKAFGTIF